MRLVQVKPRVPPAKKQKKRRVPYVVALFLAAALTVLYFRPLPPAQISLQLQEPPAPGVPNIAWPETGTAAVSAVGYDFLSTNQAPEPVSTASMAKVITVLCVLEKRPLTLGQQGPIITMSAADAQRYEKELEQNGSHLAVSEGEHFTQYQMLEAVMLPSANNMADTLAIWAFGSLSNYQSYAQNFAQRHGLVHTHIGPDASGFDSSTTSTTADLTQLGKLALQNPVVMKVAGTKTARFATAGEVHNTNSLLGNGVLTGLKTGSNEGNSGGFIFTSTIEPSGHKIGLTGAVVNAGSSGTAVQEAERLATSLTDDFEATTYTTSGQQVGTLTTAWGAKTPIYSERGTTVVRWRPNKIWHTETLLKTTGVNPGIVGSLTVRTNGSKATTQLISKQPAPKPSVWWRLTHIR